ncbi:cation diffusion facilitator family transporter [Siccirubricoccus phaeus]|uniref:cation diffusion facilitator family transporter n=1 Tax=Siccirubricoccus phaeus TaxID=2595053 RepID=UPI0011F13817|nr:cation diffusion facilitator family transporter [Siccirubricoccus phaeus]
MPRAVQLALGSLVVGCLVLAIKFGAWWVTGSVALYSDALESIINVAAAAAAVVALRVSALPPDTNHPYGHHKAEYFSAVLEGVLVLLAALSILREAYLGFLSPRPVDAPLLGMAINGAATAMNAAWSAVLLRFGRRWRSPALVADGRHLLTDVVTSGGVLVGFALVPLTGWLWLDPALAAVVAVNILWTGWGLVRDSVGGLMDEAPDPETLGRVRDLISAHADGAIEAHDLRVRRAGRMVFVEFHLVVPGAMPVSEAHDICDRIEHALRDEVGEAVITIHVEPEGKAKQHGVLVL